MIKLDTQGFRVINSKNPDEPIEIRESGKGNKYMRIPAVPYLTSDEEETFWTQILIFGEDCIEGLKHKDLILVKGRMEFTYYLSEPAEKIIAGLSEEEQAILKHRGRPQFTLLADTASLSSQEEIREAMGFGKPAEEADLESGGASDEEIPF